VDGDPPTAFRLGATLATANVNDFTRFEPAGLKLSAVD
jgi:hypothetical protein